MPVDTESPPAPGNVRLRVGDWAVEPALNQVSAAGKIVKLEPKAMAVLIYLADRPGQVVSRDSLLSAVWPGSVVGDGRAPRRDGARGLAHADPSAHPLGRRTRSRA